VSIGEAEVMRYHSNLLKTMKTLRSLFVWLPVLLIAGGFATGGQAAAVGVSGYGYDPTGASVGYSTNATPGSANAAVAPRLYTDRLKRMEKRRSADFRPAPERMCACLLFFVPA
jgi:hypothetical protein